MSHFKLLQWVILVDNYFKLNKRSYEESDLQKTEPPALA